MSPAGRRALVDLEGPSPAAASVLLPVLVAAVLVVALHATPTAWITGIVSVVPFFRLDRRTRRYRVGVREDHVRVQSLLFGVIPLLPSRVPLSWSLARDDEDWGSSGSGGIMLYPPSGEGLYGAVVFGPADEAAVGALLGELGARIDAARAALSAGDLGREQRPGSGDLHPLWLLIDPRSVARNAWGRVVSAVLRREARVAGVALPPGTRLHLAHAGRWIAPSTPDRVERAELGARAWLPELGRAAQPGAELCWDEQRRLSRIERAFAGEIALEGFRVDGRESVAFDARGRLRGFTALDPIALGDLALPPGTSFAACSAWALVLHLPAAAGETSRPRLHFSFTRRAKRAGLAQILRDPRRYLYPRGTRHDASARSRGVDLWKT